MTQDERWLMKYNEAMEFMAANHRNSSRYDPEERYKYCNWIKHNRKLLNAGEMKSERTELFKQLLEIIEKYKHVNQYA